MPMNPYYPYQYGQNLSMQQPQVPQMQQTSQSQFVMVRSEAEARNYPVGFGNNVLFKDETAPYVYSKTMGFSQLDKPQFEKYRLVKEEVEETKPETDYRSELDRLWDEINALKERKYEQPRKSNGNVPTVQTKSNGNVKQEV